MMYLLNSYSECFVREFLYLSFHTCLSIAVNCFQAGDLFCNRGTSDTSGWSSGALSYEDIDNDHSDPQMCSMYATDIYVHLRMAEVRLHTFVSLGRNWALQSHGNARCFTVYMAMCQQFISICSDRCLIRIFRVRRLKGGLQPTLWTQCNRISTRLCEEFLLIG